MSDYVLWGMAPTRAKAVPKAVPNRQNQCHATSAKSGATTNDPTPYGVGGGLDRAETGGTALPTMVLDAGWTRYRICPECEELQPPNGMRTFLAEHRVLRRRCMFCGHWADGYDFEKVTG